MALESGLVSRHFEVRGIASATHSDALELSLCSWRIHLNF